MAEYIDREAAVKFARRAYNQWNLAMAAADGKREITLVYKRQELCKAVESVFADSPVADVAPVVHGRWETNADPGEEIKDFHCSVCDYLLCDIDTACMIPGQNDFYFCPSCGAKMDLEE